MTVLPIHYYHESVVDARKNLSSKFDKFLPERSQFDSDHDVDFSTPTSCQSATLCDRFLRLSFVSYDKKT